jgi:general secretion pathway protein K
MSRAYRQRGAALLTAMLTVTLVATLAAAALWQQWRGVEIESAERQRVQFSWVLNGALDWARLILQEDARTSQVDHLSEPWALPLQEARLSSFLAVDKDTTDDALDAFLSGQILDEQARLNVNNLVVDGVRQIAPFKAFGRLFGLLKIPESQLELLVSNLLKAQLAGAPGKTPVAGTSATAPLLPVHIHQLVWLGLPAATVQRLAPFVTLLPGQNAVNLNTAQPEVLCAVLPGLEIGMARRMATQRAAAHYATVGEAVRAAGLRDEQVDMTQVGVSSRFFTVRGRLRIGDMMVQERSLVERQGTLVKVLWRQREVAGSDAGAATASLQ